MSRSIVGEFASRHARPFTIIATLVAAMATSTSLYASSDADGRGRGNANNRAEAFVLDGTGKFVGIVVLQRQGGGIQVTGSFDSLPPGFHGFHVHTVGDCTAPAFTSAGGHL